MSRDIIIVVQESDIVYPIVTRDEGELMMVFNTIEEARKCAANNLMCQNYFYQIIDLDHTRVEF